MTQNLQVYKCDVCGNIVEVIHAAAGELVCCGQPMKNIQENTEDAATEKHVPAIEKLDKGIKVQVGEVPHPMEDKHYIEWIEVISGDGANRIFLGPGKTPGAEFTCEEGNVQVRAYCNLHGLWKA